MLNFAGKLVVLAAAMALPGTAMAAHDVIANDMSKCAAGAAGPAVHVQVKGFKANSGKIRVQTYPGVDGEWLEKGRWLSRIETPVSPKNDSMSFCLPVSKPGVYGVAVRHDMDGNGKSGWSDGGGFSNNPDISLFNLKPSAKKTAIRVGQGVKRITIVLNYRSGTSIEPII